MSASTLSAEPLVVGAEPAAKGPLHGAQRSQEWTNLPQL